MATEQLIIIVRASGTGQAASGIRRVGRSAQTANRAVLGLKSALLALGVGLGVRELRETIDSFINIENRIRLTTKSTEEFTGAFNGLFQVARETRAPIEATTELFRRMSINTRNLGLDQKDLLGVIRTINQAVVVSGATAKEANSGIIQLSQGFASGQLRGEEFRSVAEQLPRLLIAIADGTGLTIGQLRELAFEGGLSAEVVAKALTSQAKVIDEEFKKVTPTLEQVFTVFKNEVTLAIGSMGKLTGSTSVLTGGLLGLTEGFGNKLVNGVAGALDSFADFTRAGATVLKTLEDMGIEIIDLGRIVGTVFGTFGALISGLNVGLNILRTSANITRALWLAVGRELGLVTEETMVEAANSLVEAENDLVAAAFDAERQMNSLWDTLSDPKGLAGAESAGAALEGLATKLDVSAEQLRAAAEKGLTQPVDLPIQEGEIAPLDPGAGSAAKKVEDATKKLLSLENRLKVTREGAIDPLRAQLERMNQQVAKAKELGSLAKISTEDNRALLIGNQQVARVKGEIADLTQDQVDKEIELETLMASIRSISPEFADEMERALIAILESGEGLKRINSDLDQLTKKGSTFVKKAERDAERTAEQFGDKLAGQVSNVFQTALRGEAIDWGKFVADTTAKFFEESMSKVFQSLADSFQNLLKNVGGEGGILGGLDVGAGLGALVGVGGLLLSAALQESEAAVTSDLAQDSAVTDVRPVRGVVAGPTNIPIFQVGAELENALNPTNEILLDILSALGGAGGAAGTEPISAEEEAGSLLNSTSPTLI